VMEDCSTDAAARGNALSPTVDRRVRRTSRDVYETERSRRLGPSAILWLGAIITASKSLQ